MQATELINKQIKSFLSDIMPYQGMRPTPETKAAAQNIISYHASMLQILDLSLSQVQARDVLAKAYKAAVTK